MNHNFALTPFQETLPGDDIGEMFSQQLKAPTRGAAARQDMLSPLEELSHDQLSMYTAPQLATVLRQHEDAVNNAITDRHGGFLPLGNEKPYVVPQREECKTTLCPNCGRSGMAEEQSFLSIDGVLKGDYPPTAAVGYGFRALGGRPVVDANIVKNLGLRDLKTGLLPEQTQKIKDYEEAKAIAKGKAIKSDGHTAEVVEVAGPQKMEVTETDENAQSDSSKPANIEVGIKAGKNTSAEKVEDSVKAVKHIDTKMIVELTGSLKISSKEGPVQADATNTSSDASFDCEDSNDDVIQLYVDSDEDTLGNNAQNDEGSAIAKATEPVEGAEDGKYQTH